METVQGQALVASPYLTDPNFMRTVVYIVRHDDEGAVGLVLNRPTSVTLGSLLKELSETPVALSAPVFCGGPVEGPLVMLHQATHESDDVVCLAADQEQIVEFCAVEQDNAIEPATPDADATPYRVFDGYSGWGAGQLEGELHSGGWMVWGIEPREVFTDPERIWQLAVHRIGREILAGGIDPSRIPEDPTCN